MQKIILPLECFAYQISLIEIILNKSVPAVVLAYIISICFSQFQNLFPVETEQGVAQAIIRSVIDFKRDPWPRVSDNAKDLVKKMLDPDPKKRLTAQEVLGNYSNMISYTIERFIALYDKFLPTLSMQIILGYKMPRRPQMSHLVRL